MSVYRVLVRHGLAGPGPRKRPKDSYLRWERDEPMALWQLDIVGGAFLADGTEAKEAQIINPPLWPLFRGCRPSRGYMAGCGRAGPAGR
jgi:hypothetical protein